MVIGQPIYRAGQDEAAAAIAGYTVTNDVSMRDWQSRTLQWLQGKMFERSTPVGPYLVTGDEIGDAADLEVRCEVDGAVMQQSRTSDLLFGPAEIAAYASQAITLEPGDLLLTGTPGGVGTPASRRSTSSRARRSAPWSRASASASTGACRTRPDRARGRTANRPGSLSRGSPGSARVTACAST